MDGAVGHRRVGPGHRPGARAIRAAAAGGAGDRGPAGRDVAALGRGPAPAHRRAEAGLRRLRGRDPGAGGAEGGPPQRRPVREHGGPAAGARGARAAAGPAAGARGGPGQGPGRGGNALRGAERAAADRVRLPGDDTDRHRLRRGGLIRLVMALDLECLKSVLRCAAVRGHGSSVDATGRMGSKIDEQGSVSCRRPVGTRGRRHVRRHAAGGERHSGHGRGAHRARLQDRAGPVEPGGPGPQPGRPRQLHRQQPGRLQRLPHQPDLRRRRRPVPRAAEAGQQGRLPRRRGCRSAPSSRPTSRRMPSAGRPV